jgi:D-alanyl-D-alanine carboxypeptidase (penicillin-binding protein 5/6)
LLARLLIEEFPEYYAMFSETEFLFDGRAPQNTQNRNPLLKLGIGADGLKTGHTREAGYGLVGSAQQGDRRVIFVISGLDSAQARAEEAESIVNWAFRQFSQREIAKGGTELARAEVWMGDAPSVGLAAAEDVSALIPVLASQGLKAEVIYDGPLRAPVEAGKKVAELVIAPEGVPEIRVPLVAMEAVARGGFMPRLKTVSGVLLNRLQQGPEEQS